LGEAASLIETLKSNAHLIIDAGKRKDLTHLQSILLFKDSSKATPQTSEIEGWRGLAEGRLDSAERCNGIVTHG